MFLLNPHLDRGTPLDPVQGGIVGADGAAAARAWLGAETPTPLLALPGLANRSGVASIHVKDEGQRLGLGSFKALGGAYAVARIALEEAGRRLRREIGYEQLHSAEIRRITAGLTFACATDGNHGRSVAAGARALGSRAKIFLHKGVSEARAAAILRCGGEIIWVSGTYDDAVTEAFDQAEREGWIVISDTSRPGYEYVPALVMQGYSILAREALEAMPAPPTHLFLQAGVGGLAAAVAGHMAVVLGEARPRTVVVEPSRAACLFESLKAGKPVRVPAGPSTVMAMLECYEPSLVAWRILARLADAFMTIEEEEGVAAMRELARPRDGDPALVAGESGGSGLAGFLRAARSPEMREALGLDERSRIFLVNTEGATDPGRYRELVGLDAADVDPGTKS